MGRVGFVLGLVALLALSAYAQLRAPYIPAGEAVPIIQALRPELVPAELRGRSRADLESAWPRWVAMRDAAIRARLAEGDEDSVINFLLFGVTFTSQPRINERDLDTRLAAVQEVVAARVADLAQAVAAGGGDERLQFVRAVAARNRIDARTVAGREALQRYLRERLQRFVEEREAIAARAVAAATRAAADPSAAAPEAGTLFSGRGLSSDTTLYVDFALDAALAAIRMNRLAAPASVRRVGIVGPGLDFIDKREGYDVYPPQTLQPFAVVDSLRRLGLAHAALGVTTFDLSPRINSHIAAARARARGRSGYVLQLPRDTAFEWNPLLVQFWEQFGDRIGSAAEPVAAPAGVLMRAVTVRPDVVRAVTPRDLNIVLQRLEPLPAANRYDLIVATNILVYYDVFEQSLAMANAARMLKSGGLLLTNSPVFELPSTPMRSVGFTDVRYEQRDAARDRIFWYQRQ